MTQPETSLETLDTLPTLLIVDDVSGNRKLLASLIKTSIPCKLLLAKSGIDALKIFENDKATLPSLILLDVMMPEMDGFETIKRIKAFKKAPDIPVLFITAMNSEEDKLKCFQAGGTDFISKPFQQQELIHRISIHLELQQLRKQTNNNSAKQLNSTSEEAIPDTGVLNTTKKLWWLHDSYWHATLVNSLGEEAASKINLEANEKFFRKYTQMLLRSKQIKRPQSIEELADIFKRIWADCFFDEMYLHEPITFNGNEATWTGKQCHANSSVKAGKMAAGYSCGCQAIRNGVMKALKLKIIHSIDKSLVQGDDQCVIRFTFEPK